MKPGGPIGNSGSRRDWQYFALSIAVSVLLVWYLFTKVDLGDLVALFMKIYIPAFLVYLGLYGCLVLVRAVRYQILVGPGKIWFPHMLLATMIRNLFVDLLPARLGSLSYIYVLSRRFGCAFELGASSLVISILFDFVVMVPLVIIAILAVGTDGNIFYNPVFITFCVVFLVTFGVLIIYLAPVLQIFYVNSGRVLKIVKLEKIPWIKFLMNKLELTIDRIREVKSRRVYTRVFFISAVVRGFKYACLYFLLYALLHSEGIELSQLSFWKVFLCIAGAELSAFLPIHGLAGIGTWATAWSLVFRVMGFDEKLAVLSGLGVHLMTQLVEYSIGICAILILLKNGSRSSPRS